jgi:hypothetical protein
MGKAKKGSTNASLGLASGPANGPAEPVDDGTCHARHPEDSAGIRNSRTSTKTNAYLAKISGKDFKNARRSRRPLSPQEEAQEIAERAGQAAIAKQAIALAGRLWLHSKTSLSDRLSGSLLT